MGELGDTAYGGAVTSGDGSGDGLRAPSSVSPKLAALLGQTLGGRYRVTELIGAGGMGAVYRAEHIQLQKPVALKVLNAEMAAHREAMLRFEREAMVSARISHPNVVSATDSGRLDDGSLYLVLEFVSGRSLRDLIDKEGRLEPARALAIAAQIAEALAAAHAAGIVHRDLKPGNVMLLSHENNLEFVKVLDFGLARVLGERSAGEQLTRSGAVFGTPEYMAPEQARGEAVDPPADLYALGVILYELLVGRPPFRAPELVAVLLKHLQEAPPPLPADIPRPLAEYVMSLLDKQPARRPGDARQVAKALRRLAPQRPMLSSAPPGPNGAAASAAAPRSNPLARLGFERLGFERLGFERLGLDRLTLDRAQIGRAVSSLRGLGRWLWTAQRSLAQGHPARRVALYATAGLTVGALLTLLLWPHRINQDLQRRASQGELQAMGAIAAVPPVQRPGAASLALALGYLSGGQLEPALGAFGAALDADPKLAENKDVLNGVRRIADDPALRERAFELAATRLGAGGADLLFDVWTAKGAKATVMRSVRKWLDKDTVRAAASPALAIALSIRETHGCSALRDLLPKLRVQGDERSLAPLKRLQARSGCGFLSLEDCYSCLRADGNLEPTIAAVSERAAPRFEVRPPADAKAPAAGVSSASSGAKDQ